MFNQLNVTDLQRGLLFKNGSFEKVLTPKRYSFWNIADKYTARFYDITKSVEVDDNMEQLLALYPERFADHLSVVETGSDSIALIYRGEQLVHVVPENSKMAYWKAINAPTVVMHRFEEGNQIPEAVGEMCNKLAGCSCKITDYKVARHERLMLTRQGKFEALLGQGHYYFWNRIDGFDVEKLPVSDTDLYQNPDWLEYAKTHEVAQEFFTPCETSINEIALVYQNGVLVDYVPPAHSGVYCNDARPLDIQPQVAELGKAVDASLLKQMEHNNVSKVYCALLDDIHLETVAEQQIGFLYINGKLAQTVAAGQYAWWNFDSRFELKRLDLRLQNMEVNGQEILTKDRVNLRINLLADWKITDANIVMHELADHQMHLYRELQLALRTVVSTKTLDELLDDKNILNQDVMGIVADKVKAVGLALHTVGVKDIILPGEMRDILGQVVEAQKMAEANLIKRREETQATRSLHNTAKVMEGNATLLRLKELEVLEKITSQVGTLNVYGGLEGVMNSMVKLPVDAQPREVLEHE